ncbi:1-alkyl-2-acetylglycerophosphocholine esterase, partial [Fusarium albosuccineum]
MAEVASMSTSSVEMKPQEDVSTQLFEFFLRIRHSYDFGSLFETIDEASDESELDTILGNLGEDNAQLGAHHALLKGQTPLHMAVIANRFWAVNRLLEAGAPVDATDCEGLRPLHFACRKGNIKIVNKLMSARADINVVSNYGVTPLGEACERGQKDVVSLLLISNADAQVTQEHERPPLQTAVKYGYTEIVELFLRKYHDIIDTTDNNGQTPLHIASQHESRTMVDLLLKYGANPALTDKEQRLPLHCACQYSSKSVVENLLWEEAARNRINAGDCQGQTALHYAATRVQDEICEILLRNGANIDTRDHDGRTPLMVAVQQGHFRNPSSVDSRTLSFESSLSDESDGCPEVVDFLLDNDAKLDLSDVKGNTVLHIAACQGSGDKVGMILDKMDGKQHSMTNSDGNTALALAFQRLRPTDIMRAMLEKLSIVDFGRDGEEEVAEEERVLFWAAESHDRHAMVPLILKKGKGLGQKPQPFGSESWTSIEWVAHREMPLLLWVLLINVPDGETEEGRKAALDRINRPATIIGHQAGHENDDASEDLGNDNQSPSKQLVRDILRDPNIFRPNSLPKSTSRKKEPLRPPVAGRKQPSALSDMEAAVVEFYELPETGDKCNTSALLRRFRPVKDVIYKDGPVKIMKEAKGALGGIFEKEALASSNEFTESRKLYARCNEQTPVFRWVHLPATN